MATLFLLISDWIMKKQKNINVNYLYKQLYFNKQFWFIKQLYFCK